jgi:hypothetical protein
MNVTVLLLSNTSNSITNTYTNNPRAILIGFTATPFRTDKKGFRDYFDVIIQMATSHELMGHKYLCPSEILDPSIAPDLDGLHTRSGDYIAKELMEKYDNTRLYGGVVDAWKEHHIPGQTIIFNVNNKKHSATQAKFFREAGIEAHSIDDSWSTKKRKDYFEAFERQEYPVLCNIGLFTEGISIDEITNVVFNVATKSMTKWVQAVPRGWRPIWNDDRSDWKRDPVTGEYIKTKVRVIDIGKNGYRLGYPEDYDIFGFTLDGNPPKVGDCPTRKCPNIIDPKEGIQCGHVSRVQVKVCPECGYVFPIAEKNKAYVDEVEFRKLKRVKTLAFQLMNKPYSHVMQGIKDKKAAHVIRFYGKIRGYKSGWAAHTAFNLGLMDFDPNDYKNKGKIKTFFEEAEKQHGWDTLYETVNLKYGEIS